METTEPGIHGSSCTYILVCIYYPNGERFLDSTFTLDNKQYLYTVTKIFLGVGVRNRQILLLLLA